MAVDPPMGRPLGLPVPCVMRHYKGALYFILTIAQHTETHQHFVVYQALKDGATWARPMAMFFSKVDTPEGRVDRFTRVT